ncbi:MAG: hypothetical protein M8357_06580 [Desulfobulbaceae bacterium]|nr:hypothetical protein [Desulfobulbaceae bacterium]
MKKLLSAAVAFGMVAGVAATASALDLEVKGSYDGAGYWIDGATDNGVSPFENSNDADWYQHRFRIQPTLIVNDKVRVNSDIRMISSNTVWGGGAAGDDTNTADGNNFNVDKLWLVYDSPIGKWEIGRRPGGAWGTDFVSSSTNADRIFWHLPTSGPLKAYVFLQKLEENDKLSGVDSDGPLVSGFNGEDRDYYEGAVGYKTDAMTIYGGIGTYQKDATGQDFWRFKTYGIIAAGPGNVVFEGDYKIGDSSSTVEIDAYAAMLAYTGTVGNISFLAGYATISGDNDNDATETNAYDVSHGTGDDFEPLYILTGNRTNVLNGDAGANPVGDAVRQAGVHALVATADYKVSEDMTLHGGLGWGMADDEPAGWDDAYGWEADLGMSYKLYQNLTYDLHFGYWFVGDFADLGGAAKSDDVMLLSHHLTMKF